MNIPEKIKELEAIEESHRKLNGELREWIKGLEELIPTKEEAEAIIYKLEDCTCPLTPDEGFNCVACYDYRTTALAKLQKIIGGD